MKIILSLVLVAPVGCGEYVERSHIEAAQTMCEPNGGLLGVRSEGGYRDGAVVHGVCANGTKFERFVK